MVLLHVYNSEESSKGTSQLSFSPHISCSRLSLFLLPFLSFAHGLFKLLPHLFQHTLWGFMLHHLFWNNCTVHCQGWLTRKRDSIRPVFEHRRFPLVFIANWSSIIGLHLHGVKQLRTIAYTGKYKYLPIMSIRSYAYIYMYFYITPTLNAFGSIETGQWNT